MNDFEREYQALTCGGGMVDFAGRTQIEIRGADRQSYLHNLCTNDVRKLQPREGCEGFITSVQGKVLGHVYVFCGAESLIVETVPGQAATLAAHFEKYHIRERVEFLVLQDVAASSDQSAAAAVGLTEWLVAGADGLKRLEAMLETPLPSGRLAHREVTWRGMSLALRRVDVLSDDCLLVSLPSDARDEFGQTLADAGFISCGCQAFAAARIERGTPLYGIDISDKNLPQEIDRNDRAISFTKGCYLGQETVARIDALGHVNQTLCGVRLEGSTVPTAGLELFRGDKPVGRLTSAAFSPQFGRPLALAYVRRGHNAPGTELQCEFGAAEVVRLPIV